MSRQEWRKKCPAPAFFVTGKDKGKLGYFWEHVVIKAKSGPNLGVVNPDTGAAFLDSERQKLTYLDFGDKVKLSEMLTRPQDGTTRYSALWQADCSEIQRMAPIEFAGHYMRAGSISPLPTSCTSWRHRAGQRLGRAGTRGP